MKHKKQNSTVDSRRKYKGISLLIISLMLIFFSSPLLLFSQNQDGNNRHGPMIPIEGKREITAIARAYPDRIGRVMINKGEWALSIDNRLYYWAHGRLLTDDQRADWEEYVGIRFYNYKRGPLQEQIISSDLAQRLNQRTEGRNNDTRKRFNGFLDALYNIHSKEEAEALMVEVNFLNFHTRVHPLLIDPMGRIEKQLRQIAAEEISVKTFLDSLQQIHGYNWRNIAGTTRRSYHSYGVALDLTHRDYKNWAYWQWAADSGIKEWWNIPITERHQVPQAVIDAFESEGFIWGGKWLFFDNIHFEYRPEVLILTEREP